jgi:hypothetical protein
MPLSSDARGYKASKKTVEIHKKIHEKILKKNPRENLENKKTRRSETETPA